MVQHADKEFLCFLKPLKGINSLCKAGRKVEWEPFGTDCARLRYMNATLPNTTCLLRWGPSLLFLGSKTRHPKRVFWNTEVLMEATIQRKMSSWEELDSLNFEGLRTQKTGSVPSHLPFPILEPKLCLGQRKSLTRLKGKTDMPLASVQPPHRCQEPRWVEKQANAPGAHRKGDGNWTGQLGSSLSCHRRCLLYLSA